MRYLFLAVDSVIVFITACLFGIVSLIPNSSFLILPFVLLFLLINIIPSPLNFKFRKTRLRICAEGTDLLLSFLIAAAMSLAGYIIAAFFLLPHAALSFFISAAVTAAVLSVVFWNGIIRVYLTSVQLGIKIRVIGILCGLIPVAHLFVLKTIISTCRAEVEFENEKEQLNAQRRDRQICKTKYPLLLVHGVFFRDYKAVNYWGRIPKELERNGATVFYGNHQSALSVADSGSELAQRIKQIVSETGCEKVNIIAHSKGGLDCRYAVSHCGADAYTASLTTINTPHRGCRFADYLLEKTPEGVKNSIAKSYNAALRKAGDDNPDFLAAVTDLTDKNCSMLNQTTADMPEIYYQSVGSKLNKATNGKFPLNFTYHIAKHFNGANDGLVSESSFRWGENYTFLTVPGKRGISHGDMVDLNRENIPDFDVREFYVQLVADLKNKGF
ncbi:MAG: triacylglycerol lipase [Ruminococcus sp.]|nr:triacylglycerol lipase [Ruminococcus sp.]